jgi:two-component system LytT family sensor kinase
MNGKDGNLRIASKLAIVATVLGLWGALVFLFAAPLAIPGSITWWQAISSGAAFWLLWLVFIPAVAWFSFRFPIERKTLVRNVGLHVLACLLLVGTNRIASRIGVRLFPREERAGAPGRPADPRTSRPGPPVSISVYSGVRAALDVIVYGSLLSLCQAITNFRRSQERERRAAELEASLASAKLQALRMQINPHFLFNTLNSIAALVYINPRAADEMLVDLSGLLRRSLESMEEQEIPLSRELEFVGAYLNIEQKRFGDRLRVEQSVPAELRSALVPALILQPLVENAIRHGIEPRRGPGLVRIEAKREGATLHLIVSDDGRGLVEKEPSERRGIGLSNTEARLRELYGADQRFSVRKAEPQGCRVDIRLPFNLEPVRIASGSNES